MRCFTRLINLFFIPLLLQGQLILNSDLSGDYTVQPGDIVQGQILFQNTGSDSLIVEVYQTDYRFKADGTNFYDEPGSNNRSNADWIEFSPKQLILSGMQHGIVNYNITVPTADSLNGTYWSLIMVEENPIRAPELAGQIQIRYKNRFGIQISTTFNGDSRKVNIAIQQPVLNVFQNKHVFSVDIENTGNCFIKPDVWLEIFDLEGNSRGVIHALSERLYPETSRRFKFDLEKMDPGTYKSILVVDCGQDDLFGANYTLKLAQ